MHKVTIRLKAPRLRLDAYLAREHPFYSRASWQRMIANGLVHVDGSPQKAGHILRGGELVSWEEPKVEESKLEAEAIPFDVVYEDTDMIAINKPAGLVVHPAPGHPHGTLVNALLHHCGDLSGIGGEKRPGIVHRLDKDTSGIIIVAKNENALNELARQFKQRSIRKEYQALVWGKPQPPSGQVDAMIGRSKHDRKKMSAVLDRGRTALTQYETVEALGPVTWVRIRIMTGRTHQIRVHMAHIHHPVVGDRQYGGRRKDAILPVAVTRQMLHAARLVIEHPQTHDEMVLEAPLPGDMRQLIEKLKVTSSQD